MKVLGISGSLRRSSFNSALLGAAAAELPRTAELVVWRGLAELPAFDEDLVPAPSAVVDLRDGIAAADAVLIATPEYNASVPGSLKNALDWASRPYPDNCLRGKPVAVIGASTGLFGAVWAHADLRKVLRAIGADVVERELAVPSAGSAFGFDGRLRDPDRARALRSVLDELVARSVRRAA